MNKKRQVYSHKLGHGRGYMMNECGSLLTLLLFCECSHHMLALQLNNHLPIVSISESHSESNFDFSTLQIQNATSWEYQTFPRHFRKSRIIKKQKGRSWLPCPTDYHQLNVKLSWSWQYTLQPARIWRIFRRERRKLFLQLKRSNELLKLISCYLKTWIYVKRNLLPVECTCWWIKHECDQWVHINVCSKSDTIISLADVYLSPYLSSYVWGVRPLLTQNLMWPRWCFPCRLRPYPLPVLLLDLHILSAALPSGLQLLVALHILLLSFKNRCPLALKWTLHNETSVKQHAEVAIKGFVPSYLRHVSA